MTTTNYSWAEAVLLDAGLPTTNNNVTNIAIWMTNENTAEPSSASPQGWATRNNPLNASLNSGPDDGTGSYPDLTTAATNTALMIRQSNMASIYNALNANASTSDFSTAVCIAPWASSHYGAADAGAPAEDIVPGRLSTYFSTEPPPPVVTSSGNVTASGPTSTSSSSAASSIDQSFAQSPYGQFASAYPPIPAPAPGFDSDVSIGQLVVNGTTADVLLGDALVTAQLDLALANASTVTLTIHDPKREIVNLPEFNQASELLFNPYSFQLCSVDKQDSVLTCTFEAYAVAVLSQATGAFTVAPGTMTRTDFARLIATESAAGVGFVGATDAYLYSLDQGYAQDNKEQLSRGTVDAPLEDSWTCLQRLASEIQWVCFESFGVIYFGPYSYLTSLPPVLSPQEFVGGIQTIDGTYDVGQPLGELTITAVADSWSPTIGQCIAITNLGPFNGNWLVSEMERDDLTEPDITITCQQPLPGLPEPSTGGSQAAVGSGAGNVQTTGGADQAQQALKFALSKVGDAYSEASGSRLGPNSYDCSGLVYMAYQSAGVQLAGSTTVAMWPNGAGESVPQGIGNLLPGDLVFFGPPGQSPAQSNGHVAMVDTINKSAGTVKIVEAANPSQGVITDTMTPVVGAPYGSTLVYFGATRPAP